MAVVCTTCPNTGREISTGVHIDAEDFHRLPDVISRVRCPHCGEEHNWSKYNAHLRDGMDDVQVPPRDPER